MNQLNLIPELQIQETNLKKLAAQKQLYSEAKITLGWQMSLTIILAVAFSITSILTKGKAVEPIIEKGTAFIAMLIALCDAMWWEPRQKRLAQEAATIQEEFDCSVFSLDWNDLKIKDHPKQEDINEKAEKALRKDPEFPTPKDWYSASAGQVPLAAARILCQRSNVRWDSKLRDRYSYGIFSLLAFLFIALIVFGLIRDVSFSDFIFKAFIPFTPAFLWGIREIKKQVETSNTLNRLHEVAISLWSKTLNKELTDAQLTQASRNLQNEIFDHRRSAPLIFDWIYDRMKKDDEEQMNKNSGDLVTEYLSKQNSLPSTSQLTLNPDKDDRSEINQQVEKVVHK